MIYFDEAGNSGDNLLDKIQPSYVLLSHNYTNEETNLLLEPILSICNAKELHFKDLKKHQKFRNAIVDLVNHDLIEAPHIFFYYAHKEFLVGVQIVDQLIEPVMEAAGLNIYQTGYNIATSNLYYLLGKSVWDKQLFAEMGDNFVKWIRNNNDENCELFYRSVENLHKITKTEYAEILEMILASRSYLKSIRSALGKYTLDATLSCFNVHCHHWAKVYNKPFNVTFDNSKQIDYWKDMIDFLTNDLPEAEVGYGSRKHKYPLLINSIKTCDSNEILQLQLADILASALNYTSIQIINGTENDFSRAVLESKLFKRTDGASLWPGKEMSAEELDMTDPTGIDPLDFIAKAAMENPEKFKKTRG